MSDEEIEERTVADARLMLDGLVKHEGDLEMWHVHADELLWAIAQWYAADRKDPTKHALARDALRYFRKQGADGGSMGWYA